MKKRTIILITIFSLAAVGGGGYGIYHLVKNGGSPVEVTSVANLNQGYWGSETSSSGTITSKANQEVHLDSNNLVDQVYVKAEDGKQSVKAYVDSVAKAAGANITIKGFVRFETGEGLEKKNEDFAAEVAKQMNA